jgi:hypothetical protein
MSLGQALAAITSLGVNMSHYQDKMVSSSEEYSRMGPQPKWEEVSESKGGMTPVNFGSDSDN